MNGTERTITAVATPKGTGGIAVIRLSGRDAVHVLGKVWKGKNLENIASHTSHLGWIVDSEGKDIDQVVVTFFRAPNSYTGEDVVEISCHGSLWIQHAVVNRLIEAGASPALAGEFTRRAFINGKIDLAQADAVADMIASTSKAAARLAASQMRGNFSRRLEQLRRELVEIGSLLELELDFSEEDVEFADREKLIELARTIYGEVCRLSASYKSGNAFKNGLNVAIAGVPNAGKSTLLNTLVQEDRAIVSDIPGTTRDAIEDVIEIEGILFRFIDTAGLRESNDSIEKIGVELTKKKIANASIVIYLLDSTQPLDPQIETMENVIDISDCRVITVLTKCVLSDITPDFDHIAISAKENIGIESLKNTLLKFATSDFDPENELIVTNSRHFEALERAKTPLQRLIEGLESGISADFLAQELRDVDIHMGQITGTVTSEEILHSIFSKFCIGK